MVVNTNRTFSLMVVLFSFLLLAGCGDSGDRPPEASGGVLDLRTHGFGTSGIVRLRGAWEFAWMQLAAPDEPLPESRDLPLVPIPASWSEYEYEGRRLPGTGFATYRLTILLPGTVEEYGLKIPQLPTASRIWADDTLLAESGIVGTSRERSRPRYLPRTVAFRPDGEQVTITVQISNFHHRRGGIRQDILFGSPAGLERETLLRLWFEQVLFASFVFAALFHLSLIPLGVLPSRRDRHAALCFGLFLSGVSLRMLFTGQMMMIRLIPDFDWETALRIEYLATYLPVPLLVGMVGTIFPEQLPVRYRLATNLPSVLIAGAVLTLPCIIYSQFNGLFQAYTIAGYLLGIVTAFRAVLAGRPGARPILFALLMILLVGLNQILFSDDLIRNGDLSPIAMLAELPHLRPFVPLLRIPYGLLTYFLSVSALLLVSLALLARASRPSFLHRIAGSREREESAAEPLRPDPGVSRPPSTVDTAMNDFCRAFDISRRERDILSLTSKGLSNREIAERLFISLPTVKTHMRNLFAKVGAANRTQLGHRLREFERLECIPDRGPGVG